MEDIFEWYDPTIAPPGVNVDMAYEILLFGYITNNQNWRKSIQR